MEKHKEEMDSVFLNLMEQINNSNKEVDDLKSNYDGPLGTSTVVKPKTISNIVTKIEQIESEIKTLKSPYIKIGGQTSKLTPAKINDFNDLVGGEASNPGPFISRAQSTVNLSIEAPNKISEL